MNIKVYLAMLLCCLLGGWFISDTIREYKRKNYFWCGLNFMFSIMFVLYLMVLVVGSLFV